MAEMRDPMADRIRPGEASDRKLSTVGMAATGGAAGLVIGTLQWLTQCYAGGHWHWIAPSQELIGVAGPVAILPVVLWIVRVFQLIGDIITRRLERIDN